MPALDYAAFDAITLDCYGTLIDWERGIVIALRRALGDAAGGLADDDLLARFAALEHDAEADGARYRDVLVRCLHGIAAPLGIGIDAATAAAFGGSVADWPVFPDSPEALARLHARFRLVPITNCDDDLFAASERRLGVSFDLVVTAQQAGRYKPELAGFQLAHARIADELGISRDRILHVAQSLFHDHVPAKALGMTTVWIDRRGGRAGGETPDAPAVTPDARFADLRAFARDVGV
jgi:2-haloalkanoic acid dehalogenase type II